MAMTLVFVLLYLMFMNSTAAQQVCNKINSCTCEMDDESGQVNLLGIGAQEGSDSLFSIPGGDGWLYKYNPCYGFTWGYYYNLSVVQTTGNGYTYFDLGIQNSTYFNSTENGEVSIHYTALDGKRTSRILLVCDAGVNTHTLKFVGELTITEYDFILESPCSCPGLCDDDGIINPVEEIGPTEESSDVNLNVNNGQIPPSTSSFWSDVGSAMVGLVFHDFFLILMIAAIVAVLRLMGLCQEPLVTTGKGFGPDDVTDRSLPLPNVNGGVGHNDSTV